MATLEDIPANWHEVYGEKMLPDLIKKYTQDWPLNQKERQCTAFHRPDVFTDLVSLEGNKSGLGNFINLCNKSTIIYDMTDGNALRTFEIIHQKWTKLRTEEEAFNDRFACARIQCPQVVFIPSLIERHIALCEKTDRTLSNGLQNLQLYQRSPGFSAFFNRKRFIHSAVVPTSKAAFILADREKSDEVLLVLTGATAGIHIDTASINFEGWTDHIVERPFEDVARMHIEYAIEFMHALDAKEQSLNNKLQHLNAIRLDAVKNEIIRDAERDLRSAKENGIDHVMLREVRYSLNRVLAAAGETRN